MIDAGRESGFPKELIVRDDLDALVTPRWREYFPKDVALAEVPGKNAFGL